MAKVIQIGVSALPSGWQLKRDVMVSSDFFTATGGMYIKPETEGETLRRKIREIRSQRLVELSDTYKRATGRTALSDALNPGERLAAETFTME